MSSKTSKEKNTHNSVLFQSFCLAFCRYTKFLANFLRIKNIKEIDYGLTFFYIFHLMYVK